MLVILQDAIREFRKFVDLESASSIILIGATILALLISNSTFAHFYEVLLHGDLVLKIGHQINVHIEPLEFWINDGLMTLFFLLIGLELKREVLEGQLSQGAKVVLLPVIAAAGGALIPALIYAALNWDNSSALNGWAIPSATDIAFSLGILMLLGERIPLSLKLFLMALAIIDDLVAIIIIALFYSTQELQPYYLALAATILTIPKILFYWKKIANLKLYLILLLFLWFFILKSGLHATLAGIALAFFIPSLRDGGYPLLHEFEEKLHPWVAYLILPIFAFANAGVSFEGMNLNVLLEPVPLGIMLGLFIGKQLGVFGFAWLTIKLGLAPLPENANWMSLYGVSVLCGVGFTMSLFIGGLAFTDAEYMTQVRLSVLLGSFLSAIVGYIILLIAIAKQE